MQNKENALNYQSANTAIILPIEVWQDIQKRLEFVENQLKQPIQILDTYLTVEELATFIKKKPSTVYGMVHFGKIPYLKTGAKVLFSKKTIEQWISEGCPHISKERLEAEASNYIVNGSNNKTRKK